MADNDAIKVHDLRPAPGAKTAKTRVGRGEASKGKTAGRGHKGQKSRAGGYHKVGFEGGQMPLQRRLPKVGFRSLTAKDTVEVLLYQLDKLQAGEVDFAALRAAKLVPANARKIKIVKKGDVSKAFVLKGLTVTAGARAAIEAAGGRIEE